MLCNIIHKALGACQTNQLPPFGFNYYNFPFVLRINVMNQNTQTRISQVGTNIKYSKENTITFLHVVTSLPISREPRQGPVKQQLPTQHVSPSHRCRVYPGI